MNKEFSLVPQRVKAAGGGNALSNIEAVLLKQTQLLEQWIKTNSATAETSSLVARNKHGHPVGPIALAQDHHPLYELGFFQDCALEPAVMSLLIQPINSIVNMIPVRPKVVTHRKYAFLTAYNVIDAVTDPVQEEPDTGCDPCMLLDSNMDLCTMQFADGRLCRRTKTLEVNELFRKYCEREYSDFFFEGDLRGVSAFEPPFWDAMPDRDFIRTTAVRRQLHNIARYFQLWMLRKVWTADPVNNVGTAYKEFMGLSYLINDDYGTSAKPVTSFAGSIADCSKLNSDIKDFGSRCINDGSAPGIWQFLQEMENTLFMRAMMLNLLPVQWGIFMSAVAWNELVKVLPCQMAGDGCVSVGGAQTVNLNVNDGGNGLFNLSMREQMMRSMSLTINGRSYPVYIEDALPYTQAIGAGGVQSYTGDIWFIPFTAGGKEVLFWEHYDYSKIDEQLQPIPGSQTDALGWTDGGKYHHAISFDRWCFEVQTKMEPNLVFLAPHLAGRIQNVTVCPMQAKPMAFDAAGNFNPTMGGPPTA